MFQKTKLLAAVAATAMFASSALAGDLVINFDDLNPGPKKKASTMR